MVWIGIPSFKVFQWCKQPTCEDRLTIIGVSGEEEIMNRARFFLLLT